MESLQVNDFCVYIFIYIYKHTYATYIRTHVHTYAYLKVSCIYILISTLLEKGIWAYSSCLGLSFQFDVNMNIIFFSAHGFYSSSVLFLSLILQLNLRLVPKIFSHFQFLKI